MNSYIKCAQEHIDKAQALLERWGDNLTERQIDDIRSCLKWANNYIDAFYREQP
jgi:hypothetical protein